jgi:hypothetical protein
MRDSGMTTVVGKIPITVEVNLGAIVVNRVTDPFRYGYGVSSLGNQAQRSKAATLALPEDVVDELLHSWDSPLMNL